MGGDKFGAREFNRGLGLASLPLGNRAGEVQLTFARFPHSIGGPPQGECEQGNEHGSDSGNRLRMILKKPAAPNRKLEQRDMEGGALLLIGTVGCLLTHLHKRNKAASAASPNSKSRRGDKAIHTRTIGRCSHSAIVRITCPAQD